MPDDISEVSDVSVVAKDEALVSIGGSGWDGPAGKIMLAALVASVLGLGAWLISADRQATTTNLRLAQIAATLERFDDKLGAIESQADTLVGRVIRLEEIDREHERRLSTLNDIVTNGKKPRR